MLCAHKTYSEEDHEWYSTLETIFDEAGKKWFRCTQCELTILPESLEQNCEEE